MKRYSAALLVLLGLVIIVAGTIEPLREANIMAIRPDIFSSLLIIVLELWMTVCAMECWRLL
ncbi:MAG: hypothetical protein ABSA75_03365 [Candidatus Bathyarchaeia archaeon]